jgi:hypothetical protein
LLDAEGHIRITDFGLATLLTDGSRTNSLVGTIDCASPLAMHARLPVALRCVLARLRPPTMTRCVRG